MHTLRPTPRLRQLAHQACGSAAVDEMDAVGVEGVGEGAGEGAGGEEVEGRVAGWGGAEDEDAAGWGPHGWIFACRGLWRFEDGPFHRMYALTCGERSCSWRLYPDTRCLMKVPASGRSSAVGIGIARQPVFHVWHVIRRARRGLC